MSRKGAQSLPWGLLITAMVFVFCTSAQASDTFRSVTSSVECRWERPGVLCAIKHPFHARLGAAGGYCTHQGRVGSIALPSNENSSIRDICGPITAHAPALRSGFLTHRGAIGCIAFSRSTIECRSRASGYEFKISAHDIRRAHETSATRLRRNASEDELLTEQRAEEEAEEPSPAKEPTPGSKECGPILGPLCE
jgi:hypothetical protein